MSQHDHGQPQGPALPPRTHRLREVQENRGPSITGAAGSAPGSANAQKDGRHLVAAVRGSVEIYALREDLEAAHGYLVAAARQATERLADQSPQQWGSGVKRLRVILPDEPRPRLIPGSLKEHSFIEVVNQCATLERLLDALSWASTRESGLADGRVVRCNPTTSSSQEEDDHDLVVELPNGSLAKFEVSDVASDRDGNGKEEKDLATLGVMLPAGAKDRFDVVWPNGRLFLVVSTEFAERLRRPTRHGLRAKKFHYREVKSEGQTRIFEVGKGQLTP